jgi:methylase of polypeptide subunit release factors
MDSIYNTILGLTTNVSTDLNKLILVQKFANELGWTPSYNLTPSINEDFVSIHLIVEHGLENSAVLSFLKLPFNSLNENQRRTLLNLSYNNLVDWHLHIDKENVTYVYNRNESPNNVIQVQPYRNDYVDALRSDAFEKLIGKKLSPNIPSLDDALINTISFWKRNISAELNNEISNFNISSLFNAIIFIRALEDNKRRYGGISNDYILTTAWRACSGENHFTDMIQKAIEILDLKKIPEYLLNVTDLLIFNKLDRLTISYLLHDFYQNRRAGFYNYDFSIMSKHALSRIYERYVSILKVEDSDQLTLFPKLPQEETNKAYGAVYTPQYIARFFARYIKQNLPPSTFNNIKIAEPAVGSGIFLRSLLEIKCDPRFEENTIDSIKSSFQNILGLDIDGNACQAAKLSLALLQLVLTDEFPSNLNIKQVETIKFIGETPGINNSFDVVISNPPFIATELLSEEFKERIINFLGKQYKGRPDSYLAFLKCGIDLIKPGGMGLFVLPHSFLISDSGSKLRKYLNESCWIRCLVDLSAISVFENMGIYVVLLIFQKKTNTNIIEPKCTIVKCREYVGKALQDTILEKLVDNPFYSIFEVEQSFYKNYIWSILPKSEIKLEEKISQFPKLKDFLEVRQGFVTGADDVFILNKQNLPKGEESLYIPYLPDKVIDRYSSHKSSSQFLFYPFNQNLKIDEQKLKQDFPATWEYLLTKKDYLLSKKSFKDLSEWWKPLRTRQPEHLLIPKIITPHLTIVPKFTIDLNGKFGISRSPFFIPKSSGSGERELLLYFLAILNSTPCYWYISNHSHKYSQGYTMMEVKTLENTPVPNPANVPINIFKKIINLVTERLKVSSLEGIKFEKELDNIISNLYHLNKDDIAVLNIE